MLRVAASLVLLVLLAGGGYLFYIANVGYIEFDDVHTSVLGRSQPAVVDAIGTPRGEDDWSDRTNHVFWNVREPRHTALLIFFFDGVAGHVQIANSEAYPDIARLKAQFGPENTWRVSSVRGLGGDEYEAWVHDRANVVIYESWNYVEIAYFSSPFVEEVN
jgi:hypothetical protein